MGRRTERAKQKAGDCKKPKENKYGCKERAKFRATKEWKELRKYFKENQKEDPVTLKPLGLRFNLHHMRCEKKFKEKMYYEDISDKNNFLALNSETHKIVHYLYTYYKKDPEVLKRLESILILMKELNNEENAGTN